MTLEERILQRHKSVMSFAKELDIPYTTMKGIISRGIAGTATQTAIQICKALEIEVDPCIKGVIVPVTQNPNYEFEQIIHKYKELDYFGKKAVDELLDTEYSRCTTPDEDEQPTIRIKHSYYKVSAGRGFLLGDGDNWSDNEIEVPDTPDARKADYALTIQGDSMEPVYYDGDVILVKEQNDVDIGQIGIYRLNGEGYIKKNGGDRLISLNGIYDDIIINEYDECQCLGKVIGRTSK